MPFDSSICRLCSKKAELRASHIIPDFFGRGGEEYYPTGLSGNLLPFTQPVHTEPGNRFKRMQRGYWERQHGQIEKLLCHECEQRLSGLEHYVKTFFYGSSRPIRLRPEVTSGKILKTDYRKMKLFQLSLLWRASVASGPFFAKVSHAHSHVNSITEMLLHDDPGEPKCYPCALWRMSVSAPITGLLKAANTALETMIFEPVSRPFGNGTSTLFFLGGLVWLFWVANSSPPPPFFPESNYVKEDGSFLLTDYNADDFFFEFTAKVVAAKNVTLADVEANRAAKRGSASQ